MADVINLDDRRPPPDPGNGAREVIHRKLCEVMRGFEDETSDEQWRTVDWILMTLWAEGFKVVPLDAADLATQ